MMQRFLFAVLVFVFSSVAVQAACSGSGTTWSCPAGASASNVQSAVGSASNGATITFATGSYSWSSTILLSNSKGITLICASAGGCTISSSASPVFGMSTYPGDTNTNLYRISGFVANLSGGSFVWFGNACSGCTGTLTQVRIDHNTLNYSSSSTPVGIFFGENSSVTNTYGVVDHNTFNSEGSAMLMEMIGATNNSPPSSPLGTANNMFVEDNTVKISSITDTGEGCMDSWGSQAIVWRHNTSTNCLVTAHGVTHNGGPSNIEVYNNSIGVNSGAASSGLGDGYRLFHHQGSGEMMIFNNSLTSYSGKNSDAIAVLHYRDYAQGPSIDGGIAACDGTQNRDGNRSGAYGYPCWRQPGRDPATGTYMPIYVWNNYWSDTKAQISLTLEDQGGGTPPSCSSNCDYKKYHMVANREAFNAVSASAQTSSTSPFNGSSGMGFGSLSNRPANCTTSSETAQGKGAAGVGYFATDQGSQGTLYTCSATNTWTVYYTPYTYPHPLVSGSPAPPPTNSGSPAPPQNLSVVVQ